MKHKKIVVAWLYGYILLISILYSCKEELSVTEPNSIVFTINDNGVPISGVTIEIYESSNIYSYALGTTISNSEGIAVLGPFINGEYYFQFTGHSESQFFSTGDYYNITNDEVVNELIDFVHKSGTVLIKKNESKKINFTLFDQLQGRPYRLTPKVPLSVKNNTDLQSLTVQSGTFTPSILLVDLVPATYEFHINENSYPIFSVKIERGVNVDYHPFIHVWDFLSQNKWIFDKTISIHNGSDVDIQIIKSIEFKEPYEVLIRMDDDNLINRSIPSISIDEYASFSFSFPEEYKGFQLLETQFLGGEILIDLYNQTTSEKIRQIFVLEK